MLNTSATFMRRMTARKVDPTALLSVSLALASLAFFARRDGFPRQIGPIFAMSGLFISVIALESAGRQTVTSPFGWTRDHYRQQPPYVVYTRSNDPIFRKVRELVPPGGRVLALPYFPEFYWMADSPPLDGYYEFLPWDAAYNAAPWHGFQHNLCDELKKNPPHLIDYRPGDGEQYSSHPYMACIDGILATRYETVPGYPSLSLLALLANDPHAASSQTGLSP